MQLRRVAEHRPQIGRRRHRDRDGLREGAVRDLGYVEGQTILIDYRHESQDLQRLPMLAEELVRMDIDVLVAVTTNAAQAAKKTTSTVPIVFMGVTDPITTGLAESLARPGGNSTGVTNVAAILTGKRSRRRCRGSPASPCSGSAGPDRCRSGRRASWRRPSSACSSTPWR
jgi:hypothetical protein